jgi:hypothetical protein
VLAWLTVAGVLLGLAFAVAVPLFQNPDEPSHVDRIRHQAAHPFDLPEASLRMRQVVVRASENVGLPLQYHEGWPSDLVGPRPEMPPFSAGTDPDRPACAACQSYQYAHPPAYYLLLAPASAVLEPLRSDLHVLGLRIVNVLIALPLPWLCWWLSRELFLSPAAALGAAALGALNGPVVAATSSVNNDSLAYVASAAVLALAATVLRDGRTTSRAVALGLVIALAGLTKVTALPVAVVGGVALLAAPGPQRLRTTLLGAAIAAPGAGWWLRNLVVEGRLTPGGTELFDASAPPRPDSDAFPAYLADQIGLLLHRALGLYGWAQRLVPEWVAWTALVVALLLALGWVGTSGLPRWRRPPATALLWLTPALAVLTVVASSYGNHRRTGAVTGLSGRYLYPAAPLVWALLAAAVVAIVGRRATPMLVARGTGLAALAAGLGSLAYCLTGLYSTVGIRTMSDRMELVAPVAPAGAAVAGLLALTCLAAVMAGRVHWDANTAP